jgi:predicted small lipoprotein YifL
MDCKTAVSPETAHRPTRGRGRRLPSLSPLLLLAALVLAGCGWPGPVAMPRVVAVAGTAELESRYAEYASTCQRDRRAARKPSPKRFCNNTSPARRHASFSTRC